jgi:tetratricopeptide (TPR) repeat protein
MNDAPLERALYTKMDHGLAAGLFVLSCALYAQTLVPGFGFLLFDDHLYVTHNTMVRNGLSPDTAAWAFQRSSIVAGNWHPLTVMSHMLDVRIFGLEPGEGLFGLGPRGHHLTNLLLHALNVTLLFYLLRRMRLAMWPSALAAALFAWHPLRVESVAWISERKDVLSTCFWLLAMLAYVEYAKVHRWWSYALVMLFLITGLLAKAMVVTLPCVLLLVDFWPLGRMQGAKLSEKVFWRRLGLLVAEKIPLMLVTGWISYVTIHAQRATGALAELGQIPIMFRLLNVLSTYNVYIWNTLWPQGLAPYYPLESQNYDLIQGLFSLAGILLVTGLTLSVARKMPYVTVGWLWYAGTLVPVVGIVRVGSQAYADRYTYIPSMGLAILAAFSAAELVRRRPEWRLWVSGACVLVLVAWAVITTRQLSYWKNTETLFRHTLEVTSNNHVAHLTLGTGYHVNGQYEKALEQADRALKLDENLPIAHYNKAVTLRAMGRFEEAFASYKRALENNHPQPWLVLGGMGITSFKMEDYDQAEGYFQESVRSARQSGGDYFDGWRGLVMSQLRQDYENSQQGRDAVETTIHSAETLIKLHPDDLPLLLDLAWVYATHPEEAFRDGPRAVELATRACTLQRYSSPRGLMTLAAALAQDGKFDEAATQAIQARKLIQQATERDLVQDDPESSDQLERQQQRAKHLQLDEQLQQHLKLYRRGQPCRDYPMRD